MNPQGQPQNSNIDWTSSDHGVVLNDGTKVPYSQLQQYDPQLYSNYVKNLGQPAAEINQTQTSTAATGASIPGVRAESGIKQVQQQQISSPQNLSKDLASKMTLPSAIKKYTSLGMSADDIFRQYIGESPWGLPNQNPQQLQELGVSAKALGDIGTPGSFMDRYNTKNAVEELRNAKSLWNKTNLEAKLPFLSNFSTSAAAYKTAKTAVGDHLSSLIPGASGAQQSVKELSDTLPNVGDVSQMNPDKGNVQFDTLEEQLLKSKGYSAKALGIAPNPSSQHSNSPQSSNDPGASIGGFASNVVSDGKSVLNNILNTASNAYSSGRKAAIDGVLGNPGAIDKVANPTQMIGSTAMGWLQNLYKDVGSPLQGGDVVGRAGSNIYSHPVQVGVDALPFLGLKGGGSSASSVEEEGATGAQSATDLGKGFEDAPSRLKQYLSPSSSKSIVGDIRDNIIKAADQSKNTVSGDEIAKNIRGWAEGAKLSNLPDSNAIDEAAASAEKLYAGKSFKPSELKDLYDKVENGYTTKGQPRSATSAYIDRGIKGVLSDQLDGVAPGFKRTSDLFDQIYKTEKGSVRAMGKRAAGVGLGIAGYDYVRHILGL